MFSNYDRYIVTGSEDGEIVIYETNTGHVVNRLPSPGTNISVVHLLDCKADGDRVELVSCSADNANFTLWRPNMEKESNTKSREKSPAPESQFASWRRRTAESLMTQYGDRILALFHKYNFTFANNWNDLIQFIRQDPMNADARQMVRFEENQNF